MTYLIRYSPQISHLYSITFEENLVKCVISTNEDLTSLVLVIVSAIILAAPGSSVTGMKGRDEAATAEGVTAEGVKASSAEATCTGRTAEV